MTRSVGDQSASISKKITSERGGILEKDDGGSMRVMETPPAAALDSGKGQGNRSLDACSRQPGRSQTRVGEAVIRSVMGSMRW